MTDSEVIRVLIVDDHAVVRSGLAAFLLASEDLELVGEAANGQEAVAACKTARPDVVIMDLVMPEMDGSTATRLIREECPDTQVIALTSFDQDDLVQRALQAGAIGYLLKNVHAKDLADAIRSAHAGRPTLAPEATRALISKAGHDPALEPGYDLTPREFDVLALMTEGLDNPGIAAELTISRSTVKFHVSNILSKLGAASRTEAVSVALKQGLTDGPRR